MESTQVFLLILLKKKMWEAYAIKTTCVFHMPMDPYQFYM